MLDELYASGEDSPSRLWISPPPSNASAPFSVRRHPPLEFRRAQLRKLQDALVTHEPALIAALHADLRKSPDEAYATEIGLVLGEIRHALRHLPRG